MKHFICKECGTLVSLVNGGGKRLSCCEMHMDELTPKWEGTGSEKHTPRVAYDGNRISVSVPHPMDRDHRVDWVCIVTDRGSQRKLLEDEKGCSAEFYLSDDERLIKAFAYCNLHGLWVSDVEPDIDNEKDRGADSIHHTEKDSSLKQKGKD